jgi:hypothetical protein
MNKCLLQNCPNNQCGTHRCNQMLNTGEICGSKYHRQQHHNGACNKIDCNFCRDRELNRSSKVVIDNIRCIWCGAEFDHVQSECRFKPDIYKKDDSDDSDKCPYCSEDNTYDGHHIADCPVNDIFNSQNSSVIKKDSNANITNKTPGVMYASNNQSNLLKCEFCKKTNHLSKDCHFRPNKTSYQLTPVYHNDNDEKYKNILGSKLRNFNPKTNYNTVYAFNIFYNTSTAKSYFLACYRNVSGNNKGKLWNQGGRIDGSDGILETLIKESNEEAGIRVLNATKITQFFSKIMKNPDVALFVNMFEGSTFPEFYGPGKKFEFEVEQGELRGILSNKLHNYKKGVAWVSIDYLINSTYPDIKDSFIVDILKTDIYPNINRYI